MEAESKIHPLAIVHENAKIGKNVEIGPFAVIGENVEIGDGTRIEPHAVITGWTKIGKDRTKVREYATIHRACGAEEETRIGNDCLLMAYTHVAHNAIIGNNVIMANNASVAGHVIVEDRAVLGGFAGVHQFVKIGRNAMVGGFSKLVQDVVPYTIVDGRPANVCGLNSVGIARAGISVSSRKAIKQAYRILYRSGLKLAQAISVIEQEVDSCAEVEHFLRFLRNADRGICRENHEGNN